MQAHVHKLVARFFIVLYFLAGLWIFSDYGISWDEDAQRVNNGLVNYNYVIEDNKQELLQSSEKYHGPAFELALFSIERAFKLTDTRSIYLMRHLITFLVFFISAVCIYILSLQFYQKEVWALFTFFFYILSPRIFAESFYNCKDIAFLSLFTISLFTFYRVIQKRSFVNIVYHAAVTGFMVDIRITGILIPVFTLLHLVSDCEKKELKKNSLILTAYIAFQSFFIILFWPVLWESPVLHFVQAYKEMSRFPWKSEIRYLGVLINSVELPWHYASLWILISTPVLFLFCFAGGVIAALKKIITSTKTTFKQHQFNLLV